MKSRRCALLPLLALLGGCGASQKSPSNAPATLKLQSRAFVDGGHLPARYAGRNAPSPPLNWQGVPSDPERGAKSLALICRDPDAPGGNFIHWLMWNVPPAGSNLNEGLPRTGTLGSGARQGINGFGALGYGGPAPDLRAQPPQGQSHHYIFELFALDTKLELPAGSDESALRAALGNHVLARGELSARYP